MRILIEKVEWKGSDFAYYKKAEYHETTTDEAVKEGLITENSDFHVEIKLKDLIVNDNLVDYFRINPWCINEGADGDSLYKIHVKKLIQFGIISFNRNCW